MAHPRIPKPQILKSKNPKSQTPPPAGEKKTNKKLKIQKAKSTQSPIPKIPNWQNMSPQIFDATCDYLEVRTFFSSVAALALYKGNRPQDRHHDFCLEKWIWTKPIRLFTKTVVTIYGYNLSTHDFSGAGEKVVGRALTLEWAHRSNSH